MEQKYQLEDTVATISFERDIQLKVGLFVAEGVYAAMMESGETAVLVRATKVKRKEGNDSPSVFVDYDERPYARGEIPDGILRQSPSAKVQFISRLIENSVRPLIPSSFTQDIKIMATIMSMGEDVLPDMLAVTGSSMAAGLAEVPVTQYASVRVGLVGNNFIINPTYSQIKEGALDLVLAGTEVGVVMMEVRANQLSVEGIIEAVTFGHKAICDLISVQRKMWAEKGNLKADMGKTEDLEDIFLPEEDDTLSNHLWYLAEEQILEALATTNKDARDEMLDSIVEELEEAIRHSEDEALRVMVESDGALLGNTFKGIINNILRKRIIEEGARYDDREPGQERTLSCQVGVLPNRVPGSALLAVGASADEIAYATQVLSVVTLGKAGDNPELPDNSLPQDEKPSFSHITFLPQSGGKPKETGYAAFVERALLPVIPKKSDEFPFVIRMVSEVLSSNGSASVSSVCASTLSLMDAGVPITKPVSAVAMTLFFPGVPQGRRRLLTDCDDFENVLGDAVIRVAGTDTGITAIQMEIRDTVDAGLPVDVIEDVLEQSTQARKNHLENMLRVIDKPRPHLKANAMENAAAASIK